MAEDNIYDSTSQYAAGVATLVLKGASAGAMVVMDGDASRIMRMAEIVAGASVALERSGGASAADTLTEGTPEWRTMHSAVTRVLGPDGDGEKQFPQGEGMATRLLADVAVQNQAQAVMAAVGDPARAKALDLPDRNLVESVRDGGDLEELVRRRAMGEYHRLTPDQQDDLAETVSTGGMMSPALRREAARAEDVARMLGADKAVLAYESEGLIAPIGRDHKERSAALAAGNARPVDAIETAVVAHARAFPDPTDDAAIVARAASLANHPESDTAMGHALGIEQTRIIVFEAQRKVATGHSTGDDRLIAAGQADKADATVQVDIYDRVARTEDVVPVVRARLGHEVLDVQAEGRTRVQEIGAHQARTAGIHRS